ncbi:MULTISPECIES: biotin--[acetyl-CoA-carboxylase] ligase [Pacificibacter]|uniref:biotin--[acetyl-CoA-carboxylase] ligase n=1 Tax=Pacificibacter TaxID=1042323 RepID=UPI001C08B321|nr:MULTISPECIES: biotin--[acetyl-CoA-carboxylase] ligase [Pacificibacter]MBU2935729.1 biotin--[acetyl-CoA-carboxylase] ligase [Pacificibacter marinus]MDO6614225.1 biotin--[acetyl-CoA-carboxylase] ligase [Pacificibacter sp. 1_MG-2023]
MNIWPTGVGRIVLPQTDSTMKEAARVAASSSFVQWILTLDQTSGHGRRGRPWTMPAGNFAATLLMFPDEPADKIALRSFVASLALYDAVATATGRPEMLALKWPNDVLLNGGKFAGILLERGAHHLSIGIGANLAATPDASYVEPSPFPPVSLAHEASVLITPEDFLDILAPAYANWEHQFTTYGFEPIRTAWLARAAKLGQPIRARTTLDEHHGTFEDVDAQGNLVLRQSSGVLSIPAAEVFF